MEFPNTPIVLLVPIATLPIAWIIYSIFRRQTFKIKEVEKSRDIQSELRKKEGKHYQAILLAKDVEIKSLKSRLIKAEPYDLEEEDDW